MEDPTQLPWAIIDRDKELQSWRHVVYVIDPSARTVKIFVDGTSAGPPEPLGPSSSPLTFEELCLFGSGEDSHMAVGFELAGVEVHRCEFGAEQVAEMYVKSLAACGVCPNCQTLYTADMVPAVQTIKKDQEEKLEQEAKAKARNAPTLAEEMSLFGGGGALRFTGGDNEYLATMNARNTCQEELPYGYYQSSASLPGPPMPPIPPQQQQLCRRCHYLLPEITLAPLPAMPTAAGAKKKTLTTQEQVNLQVST